MGQHHAGADNTWRQIGFVIDFLGKDKLLTEITGNDVATAGGVASGPPAQGQLTDLAVYGQRYNRATEEAVHPRQGVGAFASTMSQYGVTIGSTSRKSACASCATMKAIASTPQ